MKKISYFITSLLITAILSCSDSSVSSDKEEKQIITPYTEGIRISWDYQTLNQIYGEQHAFYPRMITMENGDFLCAFETEGAVMLTRSRDRGKTWSEAGMVAPPDETVRSTVPELIELKNGNILLAYNTRPPAENQNPERRFGIKAKISSDNGQTWSDPIDVYEGGYEWNRGVWEPVMIQPEEDILLFFANEHPYEQSEDQEISMVRSADNGLSWSEPETISYRQGYRDGMPVPEILQDGQELVIAIEDNGIHGSEFKPVIIGYPTLEESGGEFVDGDSDQRWRALKKRDRLSPGDYGGAPYLIQLPGGETVLSFQSTQGRFTEWSQSTMAVVIGDAGARNFTSVSEPFLVDENHSALWNSLFLKDDTTVTAATSTTAYSDGQHREIYAIDGYVMDEPSIPYAEMSNASILAGDSERMNYIGSIGSYSSVQADIRSAWNRDSLYVKYEIENRENNKVSDRREAQFEAISVMLATDELSSDELVAGTYQIKCFSGGGAESYEGGSGSWNVKEVNSRCLGDGITEDSRVEANILIAAIPWDSVGGLPEQGTGWGINFKLLYTDKSTGDQYDEVVAGNTEYMPTTWNRAALHN